ncbi:MAG: hypothetical protein QJR02_13865, partial [Sinobacteraceae bacterium]|nr:hypothetical protein [Nevskiaceae bacterium]
MTRIHEHAPVDAETRLGRKRSVIYRGKPPDGLHYICLQLMEIIRLHRVWCGTGRRMMSALA